MYLYQLICGNTCIDSRIGFKGQVHILGSPTFYPHVASRSDREHQQEEDEDKGFQVVCRHPLHTKLDGPQQLTLETVYSGYKCDA